MRNRVSAKSPGLHGVCFTDAGTGTAVGSGGTILHKAGGVVTSVEEDPRIDGEIPMGFALNQNYPNPFNPSTTLQYDVPEASHVRITILDMLGRHVKTVVDNHHHAGQFRAVWDATNDRAVPVAAGIYFCRIEAGQYANVIKLALVK